MIKHMATAGRNFQQNQLQRGAAICHNWSMMRGRRQDKRQIRISFRIIMFLHTSKTAQGTGMTLLSTHPSNSPDNNMIDYSLDTTSPVLKWPWHGHQKPNNFLPMYPCLRHKTTAQTDQSLLTRQGAPTPF